MAVGLISGGCQVINTILEASRLLHNLHKAYTEPSHDSFSRIANVAFAILQGVSFVSEGAKGVGTSNIKKLEEASSFCNVPVSAAKAFIDVRNQKIGLAEAIENGVFKPLSKITHKNPQVFAQQQQIDPLDINFVDLNFIPQTLYDDTVFSRYICPITKKPIRFPVADPNGETLYECTAILEWLYRKGTSPVNNLPMRPEQLLPRPKIQDLIDARLKLYQERVQKAVRAALAFPAHPDLLQQAEDEHPI